MYVLGCIEMNSSKVGVANTVCKEQRSRSSMGDVCDTAVQNGCASVNKAACSTGATTCGGCLVVSNQMVPLVLRFRRGLD